MENGSNNKTLDSTEIGKYLTCDLTYEWYQELTTTEWKDVWEPATFFKLFHEVYVNIIVQRDNPLIALQTLNERLEDFPINAQYYVYFSLEQKLHKDLSTIFVLSNEKLKICLDLISKELTKYWPEEIINEDGNDKFRWKEVKQHCDTLSDARSKIAYLIDRNAEYRQHLIISKEASTGFDEMCRIEISRIKEQEDLQAMKAPYQGNIFLTPNKGNKINLIRIINALYEIRYFHDGNEQIPTKETVMIAIGKSLGVDLSNYDSNLSQALNTGNIENNIAIFQQMMDITKELVINKSL